MKVRWDHSLSESFHVSNGVRQGGVLSPVLFAVYLRNWLIVVVVAIGVTCLLERFAMQMIGTMCICSQSDVEYLMPHIMVSSLTLKSPSLYILCFRLRHTRPCSATI